GTRMDGSQFGTCTAVRRVGYLLQENESEGAALPTETSANEKTTSRALSAYLALIAGIVCIGWSAIFVRWTDVAGPVSAFYRMLIPAIVLLPTFLLGRKEKRLDRRTLGIIALGGVFFAMDLAFFNTSILQTSAANATLLGNNSPLFVGLMTWLIFRRRLAGTFWIGLVLAMGGS